MNTRPLVERQPGFTAEIEAALNLPLGSVIIASAMSSRQNPDVLVRTGMEGWKTTSLIIADSEIMARWRGSMPGYYNNQYASHWVKTACEQGRELLVVEATVDGS